MFELSAHIINTGLGPLTDGAGHLLLSPENAVPMFALGLFSGQRGSGAAKKALAVVPLAWLVAGLVGIWWGRGSALPFSSLSFVMLGLLIAVDRPLKTLVVAGIAGVATAWHGWANGAAMRGEGGGLLETLGAAAVAVVLFLLAAGIAIAVKPKWARTGIRVLGSWIAAIGLMLAAWAFRK